MNGPKAMVVAIIVLMAGAFLYISHTTRQAVQARGVINDSQNNHRRDVTKALNDAEKHWPN